MTADEHLLSLSEAASALGISIEGVRRRIASGDIPAIKLGESGPAPLRIRPNDLRAYVEAHQVVPR